MRRPADSTSQILTAEELERADSPSLGRGTAGSYVPVPFAPRTPDPRPMPYAAYKLMHYLGMFTMITVLAALGMHVLRGGSRADLPHRRSLSIVHGVAVALILTGGFGMLARLDIVQGGLPTWIYIKLVIWLALAGAIAFPFYGARYARALLVALPVLAAAAGATALYKPF